MYKWPLLDYQQLTHSEDYLDRMWLHFLQQYMELPEAVTDKLSVVDTEQVKIAY